LTRFDARDILGLFRLLGLGAIKCYVGKSFRCGNFCRREWFKIKLWPSIAPH